MHTETIQWHLKEDPYNHNIISSTGSKVIIQWIFCICTYNSDSQNPLRVNKHLYQVCCRSGRRSNDNNETEIQFKCWSESGWINFATSNKYSLSDNNIYLFDAHEQYILPFVAKCTMALNEKLPVGIDEIKISQRLKTIYPIDKP